MPIQIQCTSVVIRNDALDRVLEGGANNFDSIAPNAMSYSDDRISQASFMSPTDAEQFANSLELRGLDRGTASPDFVIVQSHDKSIDPPCDWLILFEYERRLIATMRGSDSRTVIAAAIDANYDADAVQHFSTVEIAEKFEFVERKGSIDTYREKATGKLVYHTRQTETFDEIFRSAFETVWNLRREPGMPTRQGSDVQTIKQTIEKLQSLAAKNPEVPKVALALGMAWFAIGSDDNAVRSLKRAAELDSENTIIMKELAGVYLAKGDFTAALQSATNAVAVKPDDAELLGNLAVIQLLSGKVAEAKITIEHALSLEPKDSINQNIHTIILNVMAGKQRQPESLEEMMQPPKLKSWLSRLFGR